MSLIVEDGTVVTNAESYISVADATTYHTARGNSTWNDIVELMTLDVAPNGTWAKGDTITGALSAKTCVIVQMLTSLTYYVKSRSGAFTLGEILSNGSATADQGAANPTFAATDAIREQCLRKATDYITQVYTDRWQGVRYDEDQLLDWPREGVVVNSWQIDTDEIPTAVKNACCELALRALSGDLYPDLSQGVLSEQVGSIAVTYDKNSPQTTRYKAIDAILAPYLSGKGGGVNMGLVRS
ncbi:MAG: DnaT-like ssDNA-binding protein [Methylobacter sp.]